MGALNQYILNGKCDNCPNEEICEADMDEHPKIGEVLDKCDNCGGILWIVGVRWVL